MAAKLARRYRVVLLAALGPSTTTIIRPPFNYGTHPPRVMDKKVVDLPEVSGSPVADQGCTRAQGLVLRGGLQKVDPVGVVVDIDDTC